MRSFPLYPFAAALLLLTACGEAANDETDPFANAETWMLDEELRIDEEEDFYLGTANDLVLSEDEERIFVSDGSFHHVKVFSAEGELRGTVGTEGEGPGEFQWPTRLLYSNDALHVQSSETISVFDAASHDYQRTVRPELVDDYRRFRTLLFEEDGEYILRYDTPPRRGDEEMDTAPRLYRVNSDGEPAEEPIAKLQSREFHFIDQGSRYVLMPTAFGGVPVAEAGPDGTIYAGFTEEVAMTIYRSDGSVVHEWSLPHDPVPVTEEDRQAHLERQAGTMFETEDTPFSEHHPAYDHLMVDHDGRAWFRMHRANEEEATWWVVSPEGQLLATVELPPAVQLHTARDGYAYGLIRDGDELPAVLRYRINEGN